MPRCLNAQLDVLALPATLPKSITYRINYPVHPRAASLGTVTRGESTIFSQYEPHTCVNASYGGRNFTKELRVHAVPGVPAGCPVMGMYLCHCCLLPMARSMLKKTINTASTISYLPIVIWCNLCRLKVHYRLDSMPNNKLYFDTPGYSWLNKSCTLPNQHYWFHIRRNRDPREWK